MAAQHAGSSTSTIQLVVERSKGVVARKAHGIDCTVLFRCYLVAAQSLSGQLQQPTNPAPVALPVLSCRGTARAVHMLLVALKYFKDCLQ
jgi:hypothetical protein